MLNHVKVVVAETFNRKVMIRDDPANTEDIVGNLVIIRGSAIFEEPAFDRVEAISLLYKDTRTFVVLQNHG